MSGAQIDIDRLADFAAGLLDPAEAAEVRRLVASEPAWSDALAALTWAEPRIQALLADQPAEPVPADVLARIDAALARERPAAPDPRPAAPARRRPWRWPRLAGVGVAVAAAAAVCFGGVTLFQHPNVGVKSSGDAGTGVAARAPHVASGGLLIIASGRDYSAQTVAQAATVANPGQAGAENNSALVPDALARLNASADRTTCLNAVTAEYGGTPTLLDYARYQGKAALVVVLSGSPKATVVVAGPNCGLAGTGSDTVYLVSR